MLFSDEEYQKIMQLVIDNSDPDEVEENVIAMVRWAEQAKVASTLLSLAMEGLIEVAIVEGEPRFSGTELGRKVVDEHVDEEFSNIVDFNFSDDG